MGICHTILTHHAPPFKITWGHWNRHGSIGYVVTVARSRTFSEINGDICKKKSTLLYLTPPLKGFPFGILYDGGVEKLEWRPYQNVKRVWRCPLIWTQYWQLERQTVEQTDRIRITISRSACIACWRAILETIYWLSSYTGVSRVRNLRCEIGFERDQVMHVTRDSFSSLIDSYIRVRAAVSIEWCWRYRILTVSQEQYSA